MNTRELGNSGLAVSALGLGCMGMSQSYGPGNDEESIGTIHRALDLGVTFFDTAAVYGLGENERLVGRALRDRRHRAVVATKCGIVRGPDGRPSALDGSASHVKQSCDESLDRLQMETIDLFYLHRVDPRVPIEETVGAMADLVRVGKVRHLGLSEAAPATIRRAHAVHRVTALQSEYSLWWRAPETELLPICRELGIGFVPFSPLGRGFLSGQVRDTGGLTASDMRRTLPRFQGGHLEHNLALVSGLEAIAARRGATPSQVALAWLLRQGDDIVPIPGTKRRQYLESNVAAVELTLTPDELQQLGAIFEPAAPRGDRYTPDLMKWVDRSGL
jgi:aryl-alcohol dehydrogenase-like predicted oxidoreductase